MNFLHDCPLTEHSLDFIYFIAEEAAIAKGIRRIVGATGTAAVAAQELGSSLEQSVRELQARFVQSGIDGEAGLDASVVQLR